MSQCNHNLHLPHRHDQELTRRYGSRVNVDGERMLVTCMGGSFSEAAAVIRQQIATAQAGSTLDAYPHPLEVLYVLPTQAKYHFERYDGPAIPQKGLGGRILQLHSLQTTTVTAATGDEEDDADGGIGSLTALFGSQRIAAAGPTGGGGMSILIGPATQDCCDRIRVAAEKVSVPSAPSLRTFSPCLDLWPAST